MPKVFYSWILPIKNESQSLPQLIKEIIRAMGKNKFEIIAIDDSSTDYSLKTLKSLTSLSAGRHGQIPQLKIIHFSSHQGKWAALSAGFKSSKGEIIITLDSDLQDDPKEVNKLLIRLSQDYDLISGWRKIRYDPFYKVAISKLGNLMVSAMTDRKFHDLNSSFKVYKRDVLENLPKQGSMLRFTMLFANKLGYRVAEVPIAHRPRLFGRSKFGLVKYLRILYDLILILLLFSGSGAIKRQN